jgi:biopolymer transport protein ExbB
MFVSLQRSTAVFLLAAMPLLCEAQEDLTIAAANTLPQNLSPWGMFMDADIIVKTVMIGLALASLITWTVLVAKTMELVAALKLQRRVLLCVSTARTLTEAEDACRRETLSTALLAEARNEWTLSADALHDGEGLKERVASRLERLQAAAARRMQKGTGVLATIGATAPFVGLFGTVWGIMNSFIGISQAQTTNLAVVAPGIAEALLATAIGLIAAIPAVVIYNHFTRQIAAYRALFTDTSEAVLRLVSRDLSRGGQPPAKPALRDALSEKRVNHGS